MEPATYNRSLSCNFEALFFEMVDDMIILRKNKKILELFPIGSGKDALNSRRKPLFYGYLKLKKIENRLKPHRFIVKKDKEILFPPSEAIKILRKQNIFLIDTDAKTEEMLNSLNIRFKRTKICKHCISEGYITIINDDSVYLLQNERVCKVCAEEEIKRELKFRSFDLSTLKTFRKLLESTHDVDKVLGVLDPKFDPVKNPELTLYDRIVLEDDDVQNMKIDEINIPIRFKKILKRNTKHLLPVQSIALENGLLEGENLLIVSATASGKTLIGELAGIPNAMDGRKFIFLTPLVALANQKYREFKKKYEKLGLKVSIRVGMSKIKAKEELSIVDSDIEDADIIIGTYEGLDFILRSGKAGILGELGTTVIDEIHMLDDEERGSRLSGLMNRLNKLFPNAQFIGLSATIKNPEEVAQRFRMNLVKYDKRPVPLERHLIFSRSEHEKTDIIAKLAKEEYKKISKRGFRGQSIVFTNSRRKTNTISKYLAKKGVSAAAYHAGLSYTKKNKIEREFSEQKISTVVTTAALAAGVDFPASQVIFEALTMGNKWITPNEFSQMLGRAGRPSYHDVGKVFLIPEVGRKYDDETEDSKAVQLLESDVDPIHVEYSDEDLIEQILADISSGCVRDIYDLKERYESSELDDALDVLCNLRLVKEDGGRIAATKYGKAVSMSFLNYKDAEYIKENMDILSLLKMAIWLEPFENAYMSNKIHKRLCKILKINLSSRLFADSVLDILSSSDAILKLEPKLKDALINMQIEFLSCECKERPFCDCFQDELSKKIIKYRTLKMDPLEISKRLMRNYQIHTYSGDIFSWLDSIIRTLEAIRRIAKVFGNSKVLSESSKLIKAIEN